MSSPEIEERDHMEACLGSIEDNLQSIGARLNTYARDVCKRQGEATRSSIAICCMWLVRGRCTG